MSSTAFSLFVCAAGTLLLLSIIRKDTISLGFPLAYLFGLLLIHVPGAWAALITNNAYGRGFVEKGIELTAIGVVAYVGGAWMGHRLIVPSAGILRTHAKASKRTLISTNTTPDFWFFSLMGGWICVFAISGILRIPSLGAAAEKGGAIWMLGVMLGLVHSVARKSLRGAVLWLTALAVYPSLILLLAGFLSYGSTAVIICLSALAISARSYLRVLISAMIIGFLAITLFVNYFGVRTEIRDSVWGGDRMSARIGKVASMLQNLTWFNAKNPAHLFALDERLNQNLFVGLAAARLEHGEVEYKYGGTVWEAVIAVVPRAIWPNKPVYGGSPEIVREMTGLKLSKTTSWGVGNVMEFYINFGVPSVIVGFFVLGATISVLDRKAALALCAGDQGRSFVYFLPCVALIQPNGSVVELTGGAAAALVAGVVWWKIWEAWANRKGRSRKAVPRAAQYQRP